MKNLKTTIITALLMLAMVSCTVAQEKWEYAAVYNINFKTVVVNASNIERIAVEKGTDFEVAVLQKVQSMNKEGWEVYNTAPSSTHQVKFEVMFTISVKK